MAPRRLLEASLLGDRKVENLGEKCLNHLFHISSCLTVLEEFCLSFVFQDAMTLLTSLGNSLQISPNVFIESCHNDTLRVSITMLAVFSG